MSIDKYFRSAGNGETLRKQTWYGLNTTVVLGPGFVHRAGFGKLLIPHPPLASWILRQGIKEDVYEHLCLTHEFGHLQTVWLALLYFTVTLGLVINKGRLSPLQVIWLFACAQGAWEIASEVYVIKSDVKSYRSAYRGLSPTPRVVFWILMIVLSLSGMIYALML